MNSGIDFEDLCVKIIAECGWNASKTKTSGDQGADIIANRGSTSIAIQCKNQSKPVGNSSIQEALAAKAFYRTTYAAVVSSSNFTRSAKQLARKSDVFILKINDLYGISEIFNEDQAPAGTCGAVDQSLSEETFRVHVSNAAQAEIFSAARIVIDQLELPVRAHLFLNSLDQDTHTGSGEIDAMSFALLLHAADIAFTTCIPDTDINREYILASKDPKVRDLVDALGDIEYWQTLGGAAKKTREEFLRYLSLPFVQVLFSQAEYSSDSITMDMYNFPKVTIK